MNDQVFKKTKPAKKPLRDAQKTRARILEAARLRFCQHSYEQVGVRDIAADANIDAALINRYFGTKEELFAEISKGVFNAEQFIETAPAKLGEYLARRLMFGLEEKKKGSIPSSYFCARQPAQRLRRSSQISCIRISYYGWPL